MKQLPYQQYCEERRAAQRFRALTPVETLSDGHMRRDSVELVNFGSNDYLGLSRHPALIKRAAECAAEYGAGTTSSRLINGNHPLYEAIETRLARGKHSEAALVMAGGYQTNLTVIAALADSGVIGRPVVVIADRLSHHSLLQGGSLAAGVTGDTKLTRFAHNDYDHLEKLLKEQTSAQPVIVTESVFGMDGDRADLGILTQLAEKYDALLYVDEAHATGVYGPQGFGFCAEHAGRIDIAMGTFGKALGGFGAYVGCSMVLRDYLIQRCGGLVYSTALPPAVLGAIDAAIDLLPTLDKERATLAAHSSRLREALQNQGWDCGASTTQIIPVLLGGEATALSLAEILHANGIFAPAIRPPTVPPRTSRLRISLSAAHKVEDIDRLIAVLGAQAEQFARAA